MAMSCKPFFAASLTPIAQKKFSQIGNSSSNLIDFTSLPATQKWSTSQYHHALVSNPLKQLDNYLTGHPSLTVDIQTEHAQKLKVFKHVLSIVGEDRYEGLAMIDAVQRLGIDYHFQDEIEEILGKQYMISREEYEGSNHDLHEVALRFRLLRQQGYHVHADVFNSFRNKEGKFNQKVSEDIKGLMNLYEASQLSINGEEILDEAGEFSAHLLNEWIAHLDFHHANVVANTLGHPFHKNLARFMAKNSLSNFQGGNGWLHVLQEVAKIEFNMVQCIHQNEIYQISKWWNELGLAKEMKFARDQPLKWYIWSLACLTDPCLSEQRIELTKPISMIYIIDDIFDVYGTLEELTLFTDFIERWDLDAIEQLPDYMKICFKALDDITNEISYKIYKMHGWNPVDSLRKTWSSLCSAFLVEAKWFASGELPKAEEYLKNGVISSGVHVVLVHIFFLLGQGITKESVQLVDNTPGIISSPAAILRLWDDLGSAKDENQDGQDGSYVECYMNENKNLSVKDAKKYVINMISDAWKDLNKECLSPNPFSPSFTTASLNIARMVPLMYSYDDNQSLPTLEELMKSLLYESLEHNHNFGFPTLNRASSTK